jgi:hypothetical protein
MRCLKCNHNWTPKVDAPRRCPNCKSTAYMFPPGVGLAGGQRAGLSAAGLAEFEASARRGVVGLDELDQVRKPVQAQEPSLETLRAIAAGDTRARVDGSGTNMVWGDPGPETRAVDFSHAEVGKYAGRIAAGNYPGGRIEPGEALFLLDQDGPDAGVAPHCGERVWNEVEGEMYVCGLPQHDRRVKHGRFRKVEA